MRAGRGIRTAAVLMTGLVGAAVLAPGMAFAADTTPPAIECTGGQVLNAAGTACESASSGSSSETTTTAPTTTTPSTESSTPATGGAATGSTPESGHRVVGRGSRPGPGCPSGATSPGLRPVPQRRVRGRAERPDRPGGEGRPRRRTHPPTPSRRSPTQPSSLAGTTVPGTTIPEVLQNLPTGNLTGLGTIPTLPSSGEFDDAQDACLYLASKVNAPTGSEAGLGGQFASFCGGLPTTSTASLTDLITALTNLLEVAAGDPDAARPQRCHLDPRLVGRPALVVPGPRLLPALLRRGPGGPRGRPHDPNRLDGDHDGIACERNHRDYRDGVRRLPRLPGGRRRDR